MKRKISIVFTIVLLCLAAWPAGSALAEGIPDTPQLFYGYVNINGAPAPAGTEIKAVGEGVVYTSDNPLKTTTPGKYGDGLDKLVVQGPNAGTLITFYVNGVSTDKTASFVAGAAPVQVDLSVTIEEGSNGGGGSSGGGGSTGGSGGSGGDTSPTTQAVNPTSTTPTGGQPAVTTTSAVSNPTDTQPAQTTQPAVGPAQTTQAEPEPGLVAAVTTTPASTEAAPSGDDTGGGVNWWLMGGIIGGVVVVASGWFIVRHVRRY